eukprot:5256445-Heterocapsa_arctica.AAC.1
MHARAPVREVYLNQRQARQILRTAECSRLQSHAQHRCTRKGGRGPWTRAAQSNLTVFPPIFGRGGALRGAADAGAVGLLFPRGEGGGGPSHPAGGRGRGIEGNLSC